MTGVRKHWKGNSDNLTPMTPEPNRPLDQEELRREMALSNGVGGQKFLIDLYDQDFVRGLRKVMEQLLNEYLVSPDKVMALHPEMDRDLAESSARGMNLAILTRNYKGRIGHTRIGSTDMQQVIAGTGLATLEGLNAVALSLNLPVQQIIYDARVQGMLPEGGD